MTKDMPHDIRDLRLREEYGWSKTIDSVWLWMGEGKPTAKDLEVLESLRQTFGRGIYNGKP